MTVWLLSDLSNRLCCVFNSTYLFEDLDYVLALFLPSPRLMQYILIAKFNR